VANRAATMSLILFMAGAGPLGALAADVAAPGVAPTPVFWGWEVRGGLYVHDPLSPEAGSPDINAEVLAPQIFQGSGSFWSQFIPHPDLGATVNLAGKTSNLYGGAAWNFDLISGFFFSGDLGMGVNNGKTGFDVPPHFSSIGCNWWFHESGSIGYRLSDAWSVMGTVEHSSNAGLCQPNRGLTNFGVRLGYQF
jgi:lipid A 3-O-deacylase